MAANIKEGDDVYFDCRASALPPVTRLEWFHNVSRTIFQSHRLPPARVLLLALKGRGGFQPGLYYSPLANVLTLTCVCVPFFFNCVVHPVLHLSPPTTPTGKEAESQHFGGHHHDQPEPGAAAREPPQRRSLPMLGNQP